MTCSVCGKSLPPPSPLGGPKRKTCSLACNQKAYRLRKKAAGFTSYRGYFYPASVSFPIFDRGRPS